MTDDNRKLACSAEVLALVPESLAREYGLFPLKSDRSGLTVAVAEPLSAEDLDSVRFVLGREVHQIKCPAEAIWRALNDHFARQLFEDSDLSTYYRREWWNVLDDGTIIIKTSWYDKNSHMTGWTELSPDHLDFGLWTWIIAEGKRFKEIISCRRVGLALPFPMRALKPNGRASPTLRNAPSGLKFPKTLISRPSPG
jgi:hypothetical protein